MPAGSDERPSTASASSPVGSIPSRTRFGRWFRWHLAASLLVFSASAFAGYAVFGSLSIEQLSDLLPAGSPLPTVEFAPIALNNLRVLLMTLLGAITGGLLSLFVLVVNGTVVGAVVAVAVEQTSWVVVLATLAPHGVLELSAFFAAASVGLRVPHRILRYLLGWDESPLTRVEALELAVISVVLVAVIVVAAWIEVNVTPDVIRWVGGPDVLSGE